MFPPKFSFLEAPDDLASGGAATPPSQAPITAPPPAPTSPTQTAPAQAAPISGGAGAGTAVGGLGSQAAPAQATTPMSVVQALKQQYGLDLGVQDDHAALARLSQAYAWGQQNHQLVQYGQQYMQHADQFQSFLRERQAAEAAKQQAAQQQGWGWKAPEWDPTWTQKIYKNEAGQLQVVHGQDPSIINKYLAWTEHQRSVMDRMAQDPLAVIKPGLEQMIDQRAQQLIEQRMQAQQEQFSARDFVKQHSSWLHQRDANGQVQYQINPQTGRPVEVLSPTGQRFGQYVQQAEQLGLNTQGQVQYAMGMTQRDVMYAQLAGQQQQQTQAAQQTPPVDPAQQARDQFLAQAAQNALGNRQAQVAAGQQANVNGQPPPMAPTTHSLRERMMADMAAQGILPHQTVFG